MNGFELLERDPDFAEDHRHHHVRKIKYMYLTGVVTITERLRITHQPDCGLFWTDGIAFCDCDCEIVPLRWMK